MFIPPFFVDPHLRPERPDPPFIRLMRAIFVILALGVVLTVAGLMIWFQFVPPK
jgi:hypothetical protein